MTINGLSCKLIDKKGKKAEIEIEGQIVNVSSEYLPQSLKIGEEIKVHFLSVNQEKLHEKELAQAILAEILNGK